MKINTLRDLVESFKSKRGTCFFNSMVKYTYDEVYDFVERLAKGFLSMHLSIGDRVMIISKNRPEWMITTLALNYAGIVDVPRGEKASDREINYIIKHSTPKVIVVENEKVYQRVKAFKRVVSIEKVDGIPSIFDLAEKGNHVRGGYVEISPSTVASHLYTSGTTGEPKGAVLTHGNYVSNFKASQRRIGLRDDNLGISLLPLWHVFERLVEYAFLYVGASLYYSTVPTLADDFKKIRPTAIAVVPRVLEKIYDNRVMKEVSKNSLLRKVFPLMVKISESYRKVGFNPFKPLSSIPAKIMEKHLFSKLKEAFGGRMRLIISGGGKLREDIDHFFYAAGLPILEGYGLTETSPVIAVRSLKQFKIGTVGRPLDNLEVKIIDHDTGKELRCNKVGVIFVKGPSVMKEYYNNEYETRKVFYNGFFDTGDLGYIDKDGFLTITGRMKNIIVLSSGENVSPEFLEEVLKKSPLIANVVILGQDWKGLGALIEPDFENLKEILPEFKGDVSHPKVYKIYKRLVREAIRPLTGFREFERIRAFRLLQEPLQVGRELTQTLKIRRDVVEKIHHKKIEDMSIEINGRVV